MDRWTQPQQPSFPLMHTQTPHTPLLLILYSIYKGKETSLQQNQELRCGFYFTTSFL